MRPTAKISGGVSGEILINSKLSGVPEAPGEVANGC